MYDLQKILLDNYCLKYNIEVSKKEFSNGTWYYWKKMIWDNEFKEFQFSGYLTAEYLFPERFDIIEGDTGNFNAYSN